VTLRIVVAGGGISGLALALLCRRDGHDVTLCERFPEPRPVGSGLILQPTGLAVLRALGLDETIRARAAPLERLFGAALPSGRVVLDVRYSALRPHGQTAFGVHRATLFGALYDAVLAAGIRIDTNRAVRATRLEADVRTVAFADGTHSEPADLVVDALGTQSPLAPPCGHELRYGALWTNVDWVDGAGFDARALEQRYRAASVMIGVMPIGTPPGSVRPQAAVFWSLRGDRHAAWRDAGLAEWRDEVARLWPQAAPLLAQVTSPEQVTFARYAHRTLVRPMEERLIHIGDAWRSTSPQLGQGANMALLDAYALALALRGAPRDRVADALAHAVAMRRRHVLLYQAASRAFTPVYQSDSRVLPFLRDRLVGPLAKRWPATGILAAMVAGQIGRPLRALGLQ
jgi:2-polyprenyl-6-methoxyphenol hydroxylase-like FAD-dependent oxidoreductase